MKVSHIGGKAFGLLISSIFLYALIFAPSYHVVPFLASIYDDKRFLQILLLLLVLACYAVRGLRPEGYSLAFSVLFVLLLISSFFSERPPYALAETSLFVGLFFFVDYTKKTWGILGERLFFAVVVSICLSAILYMVAFYAGYVASYLENMPLKWPLPFFGFTSIRFFNQYQIWGLPLIAAPLLFQFPLIEKYKYLIFTLLAGWWVLLFASGSKGALLAIILALLVTLAFFRKEAYALSKVLVLTGVVGGVLYLFLFHLLPPLLGSNAEIERAWDVGGSARGYLWSKAVDLIAQNPLLGVGPMHYAWYPNQVAAHPHNSVLQIAAEWGVPALLIVLCMFVYGMLRWHKRFNYKTLKGEAHIYKQIIISLYCSFMAGTVYSLVSGVIVMPLSQIMGSVIIGLMLGVYHFSKNRGGGEVCHPVSGRKNYLIRFFSGVLLIVMVWSVLPEVFPRLVNHEIFLPLDQLVAGPRFWQNGGISN